ncbi:MAG: alpha-beta hydrolase superfamily lysophospholipase [Flavobacteriales bacterium]|jgi:alpha-beta hydrolase superfamily lysophospholipase
MNYTNSVFISDDNTPLTTYHWDCERPKAIIHIIHGMSEHAARYDDFASFLNQHGYLVKSSDLRGHGKTAGSIEQVGQFAMKSGWDRVVKDIKLLNESFSENSDLPTVIFGHSMGSFLARTLIKDFPETGDAYVFSATAGHPGLLGSIGKVVANINASLMGKKNRTKMMTKLAFGDFNKKYDPKRTEKDWLSKDESIVDKYINDPYCMQIFTSQFYTDLLNGVLKINSLAYFDTQAKHKPIYLFAGDMDPVGDYGKGPAEVYNKYKEAGIEDIQLKMYETGRHEMLNETNKEEVYNDVLTWLNKRIN